MNTPNTDDEPSGLENESWIAGLSKDAVFWMAIVYTVLLFSIAIIFALGFVQAPASSIPLSVPWFGALGAVLVGLQALFERRGQDWDRSYNFWHLARPPVGIILGLMSFLILSVIVTLGGSTPADVSAAPDVVGMNLYHVVAFIVGYREMTFRQLLKRVTDLILFPADEKN